MAWKMPNVAAKLGLPLVKPRLQTVAAAARTALPSVAATPESVPIATEPATPESSTTKHGARIRRLVKIPHTHRFFAFSLFFLIIGLAAIKIGGMYEANRAIAQATRGAQITTAAKLPAKSIAGFNITVSAADLPAKIQAITSQPITLTVGTRSEQIDSDTIKSWLQITANKTKSEYYIHTSQPAMAGSLTRLANEYVKAPVNEVVANEDGVDVTVVRGRGGTTLSDPNTLKTQAQQQAKDVLGGKGMQFSTPLADVPFQSANPASFDKVLIANVTSKKMWAYQNGQLVNSFLISAGAPATPTPLGEYHVYAKYTVQDMSGYNPNGTKYFQPHVRWISYFYQGSAVHGVYWHGLDWFGRINSSHGCIGLPENQAQWVYSWAPIGTTVIAHA